MTLTLRRLAQQLAVLLAGVLLVTAQSVSSACPAAACSCRPPDPVRIGHEAAYVAKVRVDRVAGPKNGYYVMTVTPMALYKGPGLERTTIATHSQTTACGMGRWEEGSVRMIVGHAAGTDSDAAGKATYVATWCTLMSQADAERVLGPPRTQDLPPLPARRPAIETAASIAQIAGIATGVSVIVGLAVAYAVLRRRRS